MIDLTPYSSKIVNKFCPKCNVRLPNRIKHSKSPTGYLVTGLEGKQLLYVTCVKCGRHINIRNLGIPDKDYEFRSNGRKKRNI